MQILPEMLLLSDPSRYMWLLECEKHVRCMTVQAAYRQHQDPKHPGQLANCERCICSYRHGPEPLPGEKHRSYWEQVAWVQLERVLQLENVQQYMSSKGHMHGRDFGYVVEARIVKGWPAGVDIYVPAIHLIIQVDGEHHDGPQQQLRDSKFNNLAEGAGHRVLRLHYSDVVSFSGHISSAVHKCMQCAESQWLMCTQRHPLACK
jgi:hypothetical protein